MTILDKLERANIIRVDNSTNDKALYVNSLASDEWVILDRQQALQLAEELKELAEQLKG